MRALFLFLVGCSSFSAPSLPGAKQACLDWFAATRAKAISCGSTPADAEAAYEEWAPTCDDVIWYDHSKVYDQCIPEELNATCEVAPTMHCPGFSRFNP
jgi:hypothetical protein